MRYRRLNFFFLVFIFSFLIFSCYYDTNLIIYSENFQILYFKANILFETFTNYYAIAVQKNSSQDIAQN